MISEFMCLTKMEKAQVIFEMVDTLMRETCLPKIICMKFIALYKNYSVKQVKEYIKLVNPDFYYFAVMYSKDGILLTTQLLDMEVINVISKIAKEFEIDNVDEYKKILKDYFENIKL